MLIRNADIWRLGIGDVRITEGRIAAVGQLEPGWDEPILDAGGGALLPGLHDHHIHLAALAVRRASVLCGPPGVNDAEGLCQALARPGSGWLRGIGYHECVAGMLDRHVLDSMAPEHPVRIQHRSGRMWFLNSAALDLLSGDPPELDRRTGRLFDGDSWLRQALGSVPPCFASASGELAAFGITGITDMSPANDPAMARHFASEQAAGRLHQSYLMAGGLSLDEPTCLAKLHLHENALPDLDDCTAFVRAAHQRGRPIAVHCTTETELVFALAAIEEAGSLRGDRIEHGSLLPDHLLDELVRLELRVAVQPHFIAERGDQYLRDVDPCDLPLLYRLRSLAEAGIVIAGGSDAPFGEPDPWAAMRAAVSRTTRSGRVMSAHEALTPEAALALFLADPFDLTLERQIEPDAPADICLLDRPWSEARDRLSCLDVRTTWTRGSIVHDRIDQPPFERRLRADALA